MIFVFLAVANSPAAFFRIALVPPPVEDADIQHTVDSRFHAGGTAGFKGSSGSVEPDIRTLEQRNHFEQQIHENQQDRDNDAHATSGYGYSCELIIEVT